MSKDVNSYRPTSFSSKSFLGEPMATRGVIVSTNTSDDSNEQSDDQRVTDVEAFLKDNPIPEEAVNYICRLPSMCSLLNSSETLDCLSMNELIALARALKISTAQSSQLSIRSRRNRERGAQSKAQILSSIADKFGEQWTTIYDIAKDMQNSSRNLKRRKQNKSTLVPSYIVESNESKLSGSHSEINKAISYVQTANKLPTRDELIFLTDDEYDAAIRFYRATHPEIIDFEKLPAGNDITTLQQLVGTFRETTEALLNCKQQAIITKNSIEKIKEIQKSKSLITPNLQSNYANQQESDSSEEHP